MDRVLLLRLAALLTAAVSAVVLLGAVLVAGTGVGVYAGWVDQPDRLHLVPGTHLLDLDVRPSWTAQVAAPVCAEVDLRALGNDGCFSFVLHQRGQEGADLGAATGAVRRTTADVLPTEVALTGPVYLDPQRGSPLALGLAAMGTLGLLVLSVLLLLLTRVLRSAARGEPFSTTSVRSLRLMGLLLIGWQVVQPLLWQFASPKALHYSEEAFGPGPLLQFGPMESSVSLTTIAFGALLVLLATVFAHGARIESEQALTV